MQKPVRIIGNSFNAEAFHFTESVGLRPKSKQSWIAGSVAVPTAPKQIFHLCKRKKWVTTVTLFLDFEKLFKNVLWRFKFAQKNIQIFFNKLARPRDSNFLHLIRVRKIQKSAVMDFKGTIYVQNV
jgi:hypothetical protein